MRRSVSPWLTRPSSSFLSFFLSLCCLSSNSLKNQICVQWAWVRRFKNQLLDWCQTSCGQLALLFSASALLLPSSTSFQSPSLFFLYLGRPDEEENNVFFFCNTALHRLSSPVSVRYSLNPFFPASLAALKTSTFDIPLQLCTVFFFFNPLTVWDH